MSCVGVLLCGFIASTVVFATVLSMHSSADRSDFQRRVHQVFAWSLVVGGLALAVLFSVYFPLPRKKPTLPTENDISYVGSCLFLLGLFYRSLLNFPKTETGVLEAASMAEGVFVGFAVACCCLIAWIIPGYWYFAGIAAITLSLGIFAALRVAEQPRRKQFLPGLALVSTFGILILLRELMPALRLVNTLEFQRADEALMDPAVLVQHKLMLTTGAVGLLLWVSVARWLETFKKKKKDESTESTSPSTTSSDFEETT